MRIRLTPWRHNHTDTLAGPEDRPRLGIPTPPPEPKRPSMGMSELENPLDRAEVSEWGTGR